MDKLKKLAAILANGYILMYFSEHLFWAHVRPEDTWSGWLMTLIAYSLSGYVFMSLVSYFRVRSLWALFLAGAIFGWVTEGVIVQTTYEELPLSISFTGLAWHALISVWVGWYAVRRAIRIGFWRTMWLAGVIGLVYGFWAITWWAEPNGMTTLPAGFLLYTLEATLLAIVAYWLYDSTLPTDWTPDRTAVIIVMVLFLLYFGFIAVPVVPIALLVLPILLASVLFPLFRNRQAEAPGSMMDNSPDREPVWRYLPLLLIPVMGTAFYGLAYFADWQIHTNQVIYLMTTPAGFVLWIVSIIKLWRKRALVASMPPQEIG